MIRDAASDSDRRFDDVQAIHATGSRLGTPAECEIASVAQVEGTVSEKIRVDRYDDIGAGEIVVGNESARPQSERLGTRRINHGRVEVDSSSRIQLTEFFQELRLQRRRGRLQQEGEPLDRK